MYYYGDAFLPHMYGGFGFGIIGILFWLVVIYIFIMILRNAGGVHHKSSAKEILKERYAKGEITKEKFESMKKDIE